MLPVVLTIAGSDPSGGAGIQADLKTFHQLRVFGTAAITLITVQNTTRVSRIQVLDPSLVSEQIDAILEDIPPNAIKTGSLGCENIVKSIASRSFDCPLIVDPVMVGKHAAILLETGAIAALRNLLLPRATLVTPNLHEASVFAGMPVENPNQMREAAVRIAQFGARSVLIKGGHLEGDALDILYHEGGFTEFRTRRIATRHTHGTGCTYSAAITAFIARGLALPDAVRCAKEFIQAAIETNPGLGHGSGPLNHWV